MQSERASERLEQRLEQQEEEARATAALQRKVHSMGAAQSQLREQMAALLKRVEGVEGRLVEGHVEGVHPQLRVVTPMRCDAALAPFGPRCDHPSWTQPSDIDAPQIQRSLRCQQLGYVRSEASSSRLGLDGGEPLREPPSRGGTSSSRRR